MKDCEDGMQLRSRVQKLEEKSGPRTYSGAIRIIQHGELTAEQLQDIEAAKAANKLVIIRQIVSPPRVKMSSTEKCCE